MESTETIHSKLESVLKLFSYSQHVEWDRLNTFEVNYKRGYQNDYLKGRLNYLTGWKYNIGKEVYISKDSFNYMTVEEHAYVCKSDSLNASKFDNSFSTEFSETKYLKLEKDYIKFQIDRITEELTERNVIDSSTNKLSNLASVWILECKQNLLKTFKSFL